ncbi:LOW QUALITY PROTEIN: BLOC-1-related complex subunit 6 [Struthio camelus]|uniref:LOW QUALITY PROTEIN: BLOC-1-related complex subunit 6 n=1 Tax=Struthio camelus TaxID=8801 RepID=UPI00360411AE
MVARSDPLLGEHGGGVRGAGSSAQCCYTRRPRPLPPPRQSPREEGARVTPLRWIPPIAGKRQPLWPRLCQSEATQTLRDTPASVRRPIRADTNSGHAPVSESQAHSAKRRDGTNCSPFESDRPIGRRAGRLGTPPRRRAANRRGRKHGAARPSAGGGCALQGMEVPVLRPAAAAPIPAPAPAPAEGAAAAARRDERSLEALSLAGGAAAARQQQQAAAAAAAEGRRATLASALELEGTVLREGRLTQFVANNLERRIRLSGAPRGEAAAAAGPIPAIDPGALQDVVALAGQVAAQVDELLRNVHCGLQALTALSVGCIQTYRDGVESLGEAADLSIRAMYALVARCEELDRAMQPVPALAKRIRDMKGTLERLEGLCK